MKMLLQQTGYSISKTKYKKTMKTIKQHGNIYHLAVKAAVFKGFLSDTDLWKDRNARNGKENINL